MEEEDDRGRLGPFLTWSFVLIGVVEVFGEIDLEFVGDALQFDGAIEEAGFLSGWWWGL